METTIVYSDPEVLERVNSLLFGSFLCVRSRGSKREALNLKPLTLNSGTASLRLEWCLPFD